MAGEHARKKSLCDVTVLCVPFWYNFCHIIYLRLLSGLVCIVYLIPGLCVNKYCKLVTIVFISSSNDNISPSDKKLM